MTSRTIPATLTNVRICTLIALVGALLIGGCGGDDEPSRAAGDTQTTTTPPSRTKESPATQTDRAPAETGDGDEPSVSTAPKRGSAKKAERRERPAKPRTIQPRTTPGDDAEEMEAEDKARKGGVPSLGGSPDQ